MEDAPIRLDARRIATTPTESRLARAGAAVAARPIATVTILVCLIATGLLRLPLCSDVAWQLWIAHHIRMGARLYVDIIEVNPPLWFWMAVPIDALGEWLGIGPGRLIVLAVAFASIVALTATERLIRHIPDTRRTALLAYATLALLVLPMWMTEQREQLLLIAALPYVALVAARRERRPVSLGLALGIGIGAALGFALKHYFLAVPALLELWLAATLRRSWRPIRIETIAIAGVGAIYAVAVVLATPDFLSRTVPLVRLAYDGTGANQWWKLLQLPQYLWLVSLVLLALERGRIGRATPLTVALLVATLGFFSAWAIQHKGWNYQGVATSGGLALAIAAMYAESGLSPNPLVPTIWLAPLLLGAFGDGSVDIYRVPLMPVAAETRPGDTVAIVSLDPGSSWPFSSAKILRYPSRYYGFWMLNSVVRHERGDHDPRSAALGRQVVRNTVVDYLCTPPGRIVFFRTHDEKAFDIAAFFRRDPAFRALMSHYRRERWDDQVDIFRQISTLPPIAPTDCRRGI